MNLFDHLLNPANWSGPAGITTRLLEHVGYSAAALAIAILIAAPIGIVIGHGESKSSVLLQGGHQVDLRRVPAESRGAAMQYRQPRLVFADVLA